MPDQELTVRQEAALATHRPADMMEAISRAAMDPTVDVVKMQALLDMLERMQATAARVEYQTALARIQGTRPRIERDGKITIRGVVQSRYATLENIDGVMKPLMDEEGFALSFDTELVDGKLMVAGRLSHRLGHSETKHFPLPIDTSGNKNATQAFGSTFSYGQRYLYKAHFNIVEVGEDKDGNTPEVSISEDQGIVITDFLAQHKLQRNPLLKWLGVDTVSEIPASRYDEVMAALRKKAGIR